MKRDFRYVKHHYCLYLLLSVSTGHKNNWTIKRNSIEKPALTTVRLFLYAPVLLENHSTLIGNFCCNQARATALKSAPAGFW